MASSASADNSASSSFVQLVSSTLSVQHKDSLSYCNTTLVAIPDELAKLATRLLFLDLSKNRISQVPSFLSQFAVLTCLKLRGNALTNFPNGIFPGMVALNELDLVDNQLSELPSDLGSLSSLERLILTGNNLTSLPPSITQLSSLRELAVAENELTSLPEDIYNLKSIEKIDASENALTHLPEHLIVCTGLRSLSVHNNQLTSLPDKLWLLESLGTLQLYENKFDEAVLPSKLLLKRAKAILSYLLAVYEGRNDDATEILEYSMNVPVRQKSVSRLGPGQLQRGQSIVSSADGKSPTLTREQSGFAGGSKPPPSPRNDTGAVASEIPSGIVNRASMSLRRASTIVDTKDEKSAISRPRPSGKSVLSRAPSQVTEANNTLSSPSTASTGGSTTITPRQRPSSIAPLPVSMTGTSPAPSPHRLDRANSHANAGSLKSAIVASPKGAPAKGASPKGSPRPKLPAGSPKVNSKTLGRTELSPAAAAAAAAVTNGIQPSNLASPPVVPKKPSLSPANKVAAPTESSANLASENHITAAIKEPKITVDGSDANVKLTNGVVDETKKDPISNPEPTEIPQLLAPEPQHVPRTATETSFDLLNIPAPNPGTLPDDLFVEPVSTPTTSPTTTPALSVQNSKQQLVSEDPPVLTPGSIGTARLTIEDAKPLIMRENSVPIPDATDGSEFVFEDAAAATDGNGNAAEPTSSPRPTANKKPSKKIKVPAEVISTGVSVAPAQTSPSNTVAARGRAKTRKILGGDSSVGTPFYGTSDIVYLPRKLNDIPLIRIHSKRFTLASPVPPPSWKEMYSPENFTLLPSGAYSGYAEHFQKEDHINFVGEDYVDGGCVIISLLKKATAETDVNCIIRTKDGDFALLIPIPDRKPKDNAGWLALLRKNTEFNGVVSRKIRLQAVMSTALPAEISEVETKLTHNKFKFGVVYCKEGQEEEEDYLSNTEGSEEFNNFLAWLGDRITLQGWNKFDGGLDTAKNATGTHSIFAEWQDNQMMFHVSTLLPAEGPQEEWVQEKKVHIGNDIVVLVFMEGESSATGFNPRKFVSHFNHAFIVINPVRQKGLTLYRMNAVYKSGVPECVPTIPPDTIFERSDKFRELLYAKLINSERAACTTELFASSLASLRYHQLYNLGKKYQAKPSGGCFAACSGKK